MQPHQQRVFLEERELNERTEKLTAFLDSQRLVQVVKADELDRLKRQLIAMRAYRAILCERIAAF